MNKPLLVATIFAASLLGGCIHSDIQPLRPLQHVEVWVPDATATTMASTAPATMMAADSQPADTQTASTEPTTAPATTETATTATAPSTTLATTTAPTTQPGKSIVRVIDPNQTSRFIYKADYDNIWKQGIALLTRTGFRLDRLDYRLGVMSTKPLASAQTPEFFRRQQTTFKNSIENTMHTQQRAVRITIEPVPDKPDFYEIAVQVIVGRQSNPDETIGGPVFIEGSGFGRSSVSLRSDYVVVKKDNPESARWVLIGHDPDLEKKLLKELFNRI